jgi:hypothetical protein
MLQTIVLVGFSRHKGYEDKRRVIHPELFSMNLAKTIVEDVTARSHDTVTKPRYWEALRFEPCEYNEFKMLPRKDFTFYWYNQELDEYTLVPLDELDDILNLIDKHEQDEVPKPVPLPLVLDIPLNERDAKLARDNPGRNHRCVLFMGQVIYSTNPDPWVETYYDIGCALVPYGANHYAILVGGTLFHLAQNQDLKLSTLTTTQEILQSVKGWKREVPQVVTNQLQKDGLGPARPLLVESVCVKGTTIDEHGYSRRPVFTKCTVIEVTASNDSVTA